MPFSFTTPDRLSRRGDRLRPAGWVLMLALAAACASSVSGVTSAPAPTAATEGAAEKTSLGLDASGDAGFDAWREDFGRRALAEGRSQAVVLALLADIRPLVREVQSGAGSQAEFVKPVWDYTRSAMSPQRIAAGEARLIAHADIFAAIEARFGLPREILAAIWGMETSYGGFMGTIDAPSALATQAALGRRKAFNEGELLALIRLIESGAAVRDDFRRASWAGAVGQTQFMPSTFLAHAADFDADGRIDLWGNAGDALASAANYLSHSGWRTGQPWVLEARLPDSFDYSLADGTRRPVEAWRRAGIELLPDADRPVDDNLRAELFLPAGSHGPAFLLFDNFSVIKRYNNADSYALAISLLADRLAGRPGPSRPWPDNLALLTVDQVRSLQAMLNRLGYDAGAPDGVIGRNTRRALQRFQADRGLRADGFATVDSLAAVAAAAG
jgi:membrane-bound lytic murein transglycosylase B